MADDTEEVFYFSNPEFTREDLVTALNEMVLEYKKLSQSFKEFKAEEESCATSAELADSSAMRLDPTNLTRKLALQRLAVVVLLIRSTTEITTPSSVCTRKREESFTDGISSSRWSEQVQPRQVAAHGGNARRAAREGRRPRGRKRRGGRRL
ncbi:hypothetical protein F511_13590 [Dorcoceras hygrometricum]|uniref:Uncharacterized protein n=1 Tax=Dorcoceras hygrometricum TaxID=472368 RepID=A0A2Z7AYT7_9LAMI|nr:hypothetical protein F511_13590 [Dorcoceras hygrometricum]